MKYFEQETGYTCGVACLRMAISHFSENVPNEVDLIPLLETNDTVGTHPDKIIEWALNNGYKCLAKEDSSIEEIDRLVADGYVVMLKISVDVPHLVVYLHQNGNHIFFNGPFFGENLSRELKKFAGDKQKYPFFRWNIKAEDFKKYIPHADFTDKESNKGFIAIKKK